MQNIEDFKKEIDAIRKFYSKNIGYQDYLHIRKIHIVNIVFLIIGYSLAWIFPNPISMVLISLAMTANWVILAHHILHGAFDKIPGIPDKYKSDYFAQGWRRLIDWMDWIYPRAWKYEHNTLHHFYVNEEVDPDQMSYRFGKTVKISPFLESIKILLGIIFWKPSYYARNTIKAEAEQQAYKQNLDFSAYRKQCYFKCYIPYVSFHYLLVPALFFPLGWKSVVFVIINRLGAEVISGLHTFFIIVPNHTADDLSLVDNHFSDRQTFYLNQIASTCNYKTGGFWNDYLHGFLNYQIEHHLFPTFTPLQLSLVQPRVKETCKKYGISYCQESVFVRASKMMQILNYRKKMQVLNHCKTKTRCNDSAE